jgi:hypothetical protein
MPRKKKKNNKAISWNPDSTLRKLQSQLVDPKVMQWLSAGSQGVRERVLQINFDTLRRTVTQIPLINGIINARTDQIMPFLKYATEQNDQGFRFEIENRTEEYRGKEIDEDEVIQLTKFIEQTGFEFDDEREDDFADYIQMMVRDIYEVDQIATEIQYNRLGEPVAFWALDGATIFRVNDEERWGRGVRFVQKIDEKIWNEYRSEDILFDYKYKRSDVRFRGYGYSPVEQTINVITTLLFGYNYIRDQLVKDKVPKGFISVMGDVAKPQMDAIRNYWYSAMSGAGGQWNIPILPSGKDGVGIDFKNLGQNNKDMEYHKTMMFISSLVGAVFGIDLAELGIKTDDSTSIIGENMEPRLQFSKDRGLTSMLAFIEQHMNKVLRKVTQKYRFRFVGMNPEDEMKTADVRNKQITGWRTINEVREEDGLEPFDEEWAKMPMNVQAVQMAMGEKAAEQQKEMMEQGGGGMPGQGGFGDYADDGYSDEAEKAEKSLPEYGSKSLRDFQKLRKSRTRIIIE